MTHELELSASVGWLCSSKVLLPDTLPADDDTDDGILSDDDAAELELKVQIETALAQTAEQMQQSDDAIDTVLGSVMYTLLPAELRKRVDRSLYFRARQQWAWYKRLRNSVVTDATYGLFGTYLYSILDERNGILSLLPIEPMQLPPLVDGILRRAVLLDQASQQHA